MATRVGKRRFGQVTVSYEARPIVPRVSATRYPMAVLECSAPLRHGDQRIAPVITVLAAAVALLLGTALGPGGHSLLRRV